MKKQTKILILLLIILFFIIVGLGAYYLFFKKEKVEEPPKNEIKITNTIEEYGYNLEDRDTTYYKEKFEELKALLNEEGFNQEEYIKLVSELFIIDLFTIDNKISRYDVGGLEFLYSDSKESFKTVAQNSIYKTVENNLDDTRNQILPVVKEVTVSNVNETTYKMPDESVVNGYAVNLTWSYEKDLGYDTSGSVILIPEDKKMSVVFYKAKN